MANLRDIDSIRSYIVEIKMAIRTLMPALEETLKLMDVDDYVSVMCDDDPSQIKIGRMQGEYNRSQKLLRCLKAVLEAREKEGDKEKKEE